MRHTAGARPRRLAGVQWQPCCKRQAPAAALAGPVSSSAGGDKLKALATAANPKPSAGWRHVVPSTSTARRPESRPGPVTS